MTGLANATIEQVGALGAVTEMLVEVERTISSMQAVRDGFLAVGSRLAVEVAGQADSVDEADLALRTVAAEFAAALRVSDRTLQRRMTEASWRVERFPLVWQAQGAGRISAGHARVICDAAEHLEDAVDRDAYSAEMVGFAETESANRVARRARRVAERFQARPIEERHKDARKKRGVWVKDLADGMAELGMRGPAALVHGAFDRLTQMAESVQEQSPPAGSDTDAAASARESAFGPGADAAWTAGDDASGAGPAEGGDAGRAAADAGATAAKDPRALGQIRADLALDLLLTGAPAGHDTAGGMLAAITANVSITVPATTLMGRGTTPAELNGCIPIDPDTARRLAGAASGWDRLLTHPFTGALLAVDRYRPTADLRRHLRARDQRCRFPTCGYPPQDCDIDHHHDAALGGGTTVENLGHLCRRHHVLKHHTPWHVEPLADGLYAWTSPTGQTYIDRPPPPNTVTFTEDDTPAPF
ncbi:HNH endonuclease signature motif containing protein [Microbacterium sp. EST19A]|uniref:HNH endonuclease signature motif containing protein n=1 Tax=Microbacterium sp. EST19A TaxID=2862681 RepID=UPI001CC0934D|nr:HNH endonuclease signature motif containing protein [Microbacterium sp. EST19A]